MRINEELELTDQAEIVRLKKVIEEKNRTISEFRKYDDERKKYYARFEENYKLMEERFEEFNNVVEACDDLDFNTKQYIQRVVQRINNRRVNDDIEGGALNGMLTRLAKLHEHLERLVCMASLIDDKELRSEIIGEIHTTQTVRSNAVSYIRRKLKSMV